MSLRSELQGTGSHFQLSTNITVPVSLQHETEEERAACFTCLTLDVPASLIVDTHELQLLNDEARLLFISHPARTSQTVEFLHMDVSRDLEAPWRPSTDESSGDGVEDHMQSIALRWPGLSQATLSIPLHTRTLPPKAGTSTRTQLVEAISVPPPRGFVSCTQLTEPQDCHNFDNSVFQDSPPTHTLLTVDSQRLRHLVPVGRAEDVHTASFLTSLVSWLGVCWLVYKTWQASGKLMRRAPPPPQQDNQEKKRQG